MKPGPCRYYLVWGLPLTVGGVLMVWLGVDIYVKNVWPEGSGQLTVLVIGALVLFAGVTALLIGVYRACAGIDYLVHHSRRASS